MPRYFMDTGLSVNAVEYTVVMRCISLTSIRPMTVCDVASMAISFDSRLLGASAKSDSR
jgi:hypothetical protein